MNWKHGAIVSIPVVLLGVYLVTRSSPSAVSSGPSVYVSRSSVDLGTVDCDSEDINVEFELENSGDADLEVTKLLSGCGCTTAKIDRSRIPAGESTMIRARVRVDEPGVHSVSILAFTNDQVNSRLDLRVRWTGTTGVQFDSTAVDFGVLGPGDERNATLRLQERAPGVRIVSVHAEEPVRASWNGNDEVVSLQLVEPSEFGHHVGALTVKLEGHRPRTMKIPLQWLVQGPLEISPANLFLGSAAPGGRLRGAVAITAKEEGLLKELTVQGSSDELNHVVSRDAQPLTMEAAFETRASGAPGFRNAQVLVQSGPHRLTLPVRWLVLSESEKP